MTDKNPFDFSDVSDLPGDIAKKLTASPAAVAYVGVLPILTAAAAAGVPALSLNQVLAAGFRMGITLPTAATVRKWLNDAEGAGKVVKPNRNTYAIAPAAEGVVATEATADTPVADEPVEEADDPLAGL